MRYKKTHLVASPWTIAHRDWKIQEMSRCLLCHTCIAPSVSTSGGYLIPVWTLSTCLHVCMSTCVLVSTFLVYECRGLTLYIMLIAPTKHITDREYATTTITCFVLLFLFTEAEPRLPVMWHSTRDVTCGILAYVCDCWWLAVTHFVTLTLTFQLPTVS